eukprot:Phypoly_transcript_05633.p1 GENE.Phypoly_transcript_05633~~Phypoly_transcript_05633.p1  ORF type:complete len:246 (+),score=19.19 Phypoly_transcript_05633:3-740(+)
MAANYWQSTHSTNWILEREVVDKSNKKDRQYINAEELKKLKIHYSNTIQNLGVGLKIRQRAISTAIVYFRRFYVRNSFIDCEPRLIATTCLYLASKVEECTTQAKKYAMKMKELDGTFPYDMNHILECEFYVLEELDFCLLVFHPYRSLQPYLADLNMESSLDSVWSIVNDSYRTDVSFSFSSSLLYPFPFFPFSFFLLLFTFSFFFFFFPFFSFNLPICHTNVIFCRYISSKKHQNGFSKKKKY